MLKKLWQGIAKNEPESLGEKALMDIVYRYMRFYFGEKKQFTRMESVLDLVQLKAPKLIMGLYVGACEVALLNLKTGDYHAFVDAVKKIRDRLAKKLESPEDWEEFLKTIKEKYTGKKKLIAMMDLVQQSEWHLVVKKKRKGKRKRGQIEEEFSDEDEDTVVNRSYKTRARKKSRR